MKIIVQETNVSAPVAGIEWVAYEDEDGLPDSLYAYGSNAPEAVANYLTLKEQSWN